MKAQKKANPPEDNPFIDGLFDWMDSPDGQLSSEVRDTVFALLDEVGVDAKARYLIWADGQRLSIDQCVQRIHADYPHFPAENIETRLISWLQGGFAPENYSEQQLDELDRLTECWIEDHYHGHRRS